MCSSWTRKVWAGIAALGIGVGLPIAQTGCSSIQVSAHDLYSSLPKEEEAVEPYHEDEIRTSMSGKSRPEEVQERVDRAIAHSDLLLGMSMAEVRDAWGAPVETENAGLARNGNERWIYRSGLSGRNGLKGETRAVYFESGRVSGWQSE